jgi:hypothetical protein
VPVYWGLWEGDVVYTQHLEYQCKINTNRSLEDDELITSVSHKVRVFAFIYPSGTLYLHCHRILSTFSILVFVHWSINKPYL